MEDGKGRGEKKTGKKNQSTIQWYIPNFCHSAQVVPCPHSEVHRPLGLPRLSEEQQLGLCLPQGTELQFEVAAMGLSSSRSMLELGMGCRLL